jgi:hypothetical protein
MAIRFRTADIDQPLSAIDLAAMGAKAVHGALASWAADRRGGIGRRFQKEAFARYGYTARSEGYQRRQQRGPFGVRPFVSYKTSATKFWNLVTVPGVGHRVHDTPSAVRPSSTLTASAARGLNFLGRGTTGAYLAEWSRAHPLEDAQIEADALRRLETEVADGA